MAGSVMTFTETTFPTIKKIKAAWTSDNATGAVSGTTTNYYSGRLIGAITVPDGVAAPTDNYDIAVNDSDSVDVALGALADRDTANTEYVAEASMAGVANDQLTIAVTNAGNSKKGTIYLYLR
jgi:hypothetical protein